MKKAVKSSGKLEKKLASFSEAQRKLIFQNVGAIELTEGCSIGCTDCGVSALKGVKDYISPGTVSEIITKYGKEMKGSLELFYYASEPFDYEFEGKNYLDIHEDYRKKTGENLCTITALPRGKEVELLEKIVEEMDLDFNEKTIKAASLTKFNYKRVERKLLESDIPKKINESDYLVNIDSLESFVRYINDNTRDEPIRDFVNGMKRYNLGTNPDEELADQSIGCFHGVLMTPSEIFNLQITTPTKENPTGEIKTPITPENFSVIPHAKYGTGMSNDLFLAQGEEEHLTVGTNIKNPFIEKLHKFIFS